MIIDFFARFVGQRFALPAFLVSAVIALSLLATLIIRLWPVDHTAERQAEQTTRSGQAVANAGAAAVAVVSTTAASEKAIDSAVNQTAKEIRNAQSPAAVRSAVVASLCKQDSHRLDPACRVR